MDQYRKRGSPVEVEEVPAGSAYRVNDGGIISYHTKETFALLYEKTEPAAVPIDGRVTTTRSDQTVATTPAPEYKFSADFKSSDISVAKALSTGEWDGDFWIDGDYRVARKWVEKYPNLYGPAATDPDAGYGNVECDDALTKAIEKILGIEAKGGLYSTWSERHCAITAMYIGYLDVESTADIPPVPKYWLSEGQYWYPHVIMGRELKKKNLAETLVQILQNPKVAAIIASAVAAGYALLPQILTAFHVTGG